MPFYLKVQGESYCYRFIITFNINLSRICYKGHNLTNKFDELIVARYILKKNIHSQSDTNYEGCEYHSLDIITYLHKTFYLNLQNAFYIYIRNSITK